MYHALCLVAATWVAVDPPQMLPQSPAYAPTGAPVAVREYQPPYQQAPMPKKAAPTLGDRISSWFAPPPKTPPQRPGTTKSHTGKPQITPASYRKPDAGQPQSRIPTHIQSQGMPTPHTGFTLTDAELQKVGHDQEYTWITGKLVRSGNRMMLVYAGQHEVDRFSGSMILLPPANMTGVQEGDLVCVHGRVANQNGAIYYQAREVNFIERLAR